jgi:hypothetical protein
VLVTSNPAHLNGASTALGVGADREREMNINISRATPPKHIASENERFYGLLPHNFCHISSFRVYNMLKASKCVYPHEILLMSNMHP